MQMIMTRMFIQKKGKRKDSRTGGASYAGGGSQKLSNYYTRLLEEPSLSQAANSRLQAVTVNLRIEGADVTIFEGQISTGAHDIKIPGTAHGEWPPFTRTFHSPPPFVSTYKREPLFVCQMLSSLHIRLPLVLLTTPPINADSPLTARSALFFYFFKSSDAFILSH
jgi:hypothetical protein